MRCQASSARNGVRKTPLKDADGWISKSARQSQSQSSAPTGVNPFSTAARGSALRTPLGGAFAVQSSSSTRSCAVSSQPCAALRPPTPTRFSLAVVPTSEAVLTRYSLCDRRAPATACAAPLGAFGFSVVRSLLRELTLRRVQPMRRVTEGGLGRHTVRCTLRCAQHGAVRLLSDGPQACRSLGTARPVREATATWVAAANGSEVVKRHGTRRDGLRPASIQCACGHRCLISLAYSLVLYSLP